MHAAILTSCSFGLVTCMLALPVSANNATKRAELYHVAAGKTYNMHANDHARILGKYAKASDHPVPAAVVKEHVSAMKTNVAQAQQAFKKLADAAGNDPKIAAQLAEISKRLTAVSQRVNALQSENDAEAKMIVDATNDISADLKSTHDASKAIDMALSEQVDSEDQADQFDNRQSPDYFFTGEGHFLD